MNNNLKGVHHIIKAISDIALSGLSSFNKDTEKGDLIAGLAKISGLSLLAMKEYCDEQLVNIKALHEPVSLDKCAKAIFDLHPYNDTT
jgi:hypothetical protein